MNEDYKKMTLLELIIELEDLIDRREYEDDWEKEFYKITKEMAERIAPRP